ncbi:hypothetical protein LIS04_02 [Listeria phage LIS04]|nr:hypothetical protein LIS04_02 [Listeria phage LIS04]
MILSRRARKLVKEFRNLGAPKSSIKFVKQLNQNKSSFRGQLFSLEDSLEYDLTNARRNTLIQNHPVIKDLEFICDSEFDHFYQQGNLVDGSDSQGFILAMNLPFYDFHQEAGLTFSIDGYRSTVSQLQVSSTMLRKDETYLDSRISNISVTDYSGFVGPDIESYSVEDKSITIVSSLEYEFDGELDHRVKLYFNSGHIVKCEVLN